MNLVKLIDGTEVSSSSEAWRLECLQRYKHVQSLLRLQGQGSRALRQEYLARVEATEGAEARRRLQEEFAAVWQAQRGAAG